jgi:peptidyl-prolyl cis-trans isomerase SurA
LIDSSIYKGKWKKPQDTELNTILFTLSGKKYTENSFADFIENNQKNTKGKSFEEIVKLSFDDFIYQSLTECEKAELEKINLDYRYLMQEYHDGMLLFELMKKEIWDKATEDTIGLKKYYEENQRDYNNQTELDISVFNYKNETFYASAEKLLMESRNSYSDSLLIVEVSDNDKEAFSLIESGSYTKGQNIYADIVFKMIESGTLTENQKIIKRESENVFVYINNKRISKTKPFDEIKGVVIADYQNYLEDKWMQELKKKYAIKVNKKELKKIKASFNQ